MHAHRDPLAASVFGVVAVPAPDEHRSIDLRESCDEVLSLPAFARRAGLSERHASRLFQLELGKTFREHLAELRLERAKQLLRDTGMTVIEVAGETGWSSLAHFNSVFRRRVGATPSQFRISQAALHPVRRAS